VKGRMDFGLDEPAWATLDRERTEAPFVVRVGGKVLQFHPASDVPAGTLVHVGSDWRLFLSFCVVNTAELAEADFAWWQAEHMLRLYRRHYGLCATPDQDRRLFGLLEQDDYRDAIEADLAEIYNADLGTLWRGRQWRKLLSFIERLRRSTHFGEVVSLDEKLAKLVLEGERKNPDSPAAAARRMAEFTVEAELLTIVADRIADLLTLTAATKGGKGRAAKPLPRPKSALADMRERREQNHVAFTLDRVFGRVDAKGQPTGTGAVSPTP
jgi:hypothetical protein